MSELQKVIKQYAETESDNVEVQDCIVECLTRRITDEIIVAESDEINRLATEKRKQSLLEEKRLKAEQQITTANKAFWTVFVTGLLIGLLGNQLTELIARAELSNMSIVAICTLLSLIIYLVYRQMYLVSAIAIINSFLTEGNDAA